MVGGAALTLGLHDLERERQRRDARDLEILNKVADELNREVGEDLEFQVDL